MVVTQTTRWMVGFAAYVLGLTFLIAAVAMACSGCSQPATPSSGPNARALARGTVETLETAWLDVANACVATGSMQTAMQCEAILDPARNSLILASDAVNSWQAADQSDFGCFLSTVVKGLADADTFLVGLKALPVNVANEIQDGLSLAAAFLPQCTADAGSNG